MKNDNCARVNDIYQMKIAFVHNMYINYRLPLFQRLSIEYNITFLFGKVDSNTKLLDNNLNFHLLKSVHFLENTISFSLIYNLLKKKYDLIIGSGGLALGLQTFIISRFARIPFILWDETWYWPKTKIRILFWPIIKLMIDKSFAIIVPGSKSKEFFISANSDPDKIFIAPNASILQLDKRKILSAKKIKEKLGLQNKKIILYFGQLIERKGVNYLIEAFARLENQISDIFLLIMGSGDKLKELENLCSQFNIKNFQFLGFIPEREKAFYISLADIFILPSIRLKKESEVWGLVLNEAMSLNKPVISTIAVGAAYDLIKNNKNGYIIHDKNSNELSEAIIKIIKDDQLRKYMGMKSKQIIEKGFTYDHMVQGFIEAIKYTARARASSITPHMELLTKTKAGGNYNSGDLDDLCKKMIRTYEGRDRYENK